MKLGTPNFNPSRLIEARETRGITAKSLAILVGVTPQSISNYERGRQTPGADTLALIADKLGLPERFFTIPSVPTVRRPVFFRSLASATKKGRAAAGWKIAWATRLVRYLSEYLDLPEYHLPDVGSSIDPMSIEASHIELAATRLRRAWGMRDGAISDVVLLMENNGIICSRHHLFDEREDALSQPMADGRRDYVLLNADKGGSVRSRFDAAHELAHLVLHRHIGEDTKEALHKDLEKQAHMFAGAFLLPAATFGRDFVTPGLDVFAQLKPKWKVSIGAMIMRSRSLGLVDDEDLGSLMRAYRYRGWHRQEPGDDVLVPEKPRLLRRAVETLVDNAIQTKQDIINTLSLAPSDIEDVSGLARGYLTNETAKIIPFPSLRVRDEADVHPAVGPVARIIDLDADWPARSSS